MQKMTRSVPEDKLFKVWGAIGPYEVGFMHRVATFHTPPEGLVVNLGILGGRSTCILCEAVGDERVVSIDDWSHPDWDFDKAVSRINGHGYFPRVISGDSAIAPDDIDSVAFLFVDTIHSRWHVTKELRSWLPRMVDGGVVAFHDYGEVVKRWAETQEEFEGLMSYSAAIDELMAGYRRVGHKFSIPVFKKL